MLRFGYASQNLTIPATTGRTLRLANLQDADRVRALVQANLQGLEAILRWNAQHGIGLFRMSQQIVPFASHPAFPYDWRAEHADGFACLGALASDLGIRLSLHPGQFIQPGSPNGDVSVRSIAELRYIAQLLSLFGNGDSTCVLHLGGAYGDKQSAANAFINAMRGETDILTFQALENDERIWTVAEVTPVAQELGIPAIVDTLHHALNSGGLDLRAVLDLGLPTWQSRPKVHLSSQDPLKQPGAHAWGVDEADALALIEALHGREADIMVEAKGKEGAVLPVMELAATAAVT
jgi:UV DNA damage endonuclease